MTETKKRHERTTPYIKHLSESADFKVSPFNKNCSYLIRNSFKMPNVSYTSTISENFAGQAFLLIQKLKLIQKWTNKNVCPTT